ncbi:hypothetical protein J2W69_000688 [Rheinheimera soli]|uniref:Uncharacterized protein n=1 Tax=Rheinheimera soli TaxID=443616 RepID=A0ABU1VVL2_9GAMM|nr:hypothetical protein [Rheinheimera soli]
MTNKDVADSQRKQHIEQLLMPAWINQMNAIWSIHQHVVVIEIATLSAFYFLLFSHEKDYQFYIVGALTFIVNILLHLCLMAVRRHAQLLCSYERTLEAGKIFPDIDKPSSISPWPNSNLLKFANHSISRLSIFLVIWINLLIFSASGFIFLSSFPDIYSLFVIVLNCIIPVGLLSNFSFKIKSTDT